jgi:hypothetical protein
MATIDLRPWVNNSLSEIQNNRQIAVNMRTLIKLGSPWPSWIYTEKRSARMVCWQYSCFRVKNAEIGHTGHEINTVKNHSHCPFET